MYPEKAPSDRHQQKDGDQSGAAFLMPFFACAGHAGKSGLDLAALGEEVAGGDREDRGGDDEADGDGLAGLRGGGGLGGDDDRVGAQLVDGVAQLVVLDLGVDPGPLAVNIVEQRDEIVQELVLHDDADREADFLGGADVEQVARGDALVAGGFLQLSVDAGQLGSLPQRIEGLLKVLLLAVVQLLAVDVRGDDDDAAGVVAVGVLRGGEFGRAGVGDAVDEVVGKSRGGEADQKHDGQQECKDLFHGVSSFQKSNNKIYMSADLIDQPGNNDEALEFVCDQAGGEHQQVVILRDLRGIVIDSCEGVDLRDALCEGRDVTGIDEAAVVVQDMQVAEGRCRENLKMQLPRRRIDDDLVQIAQALP